LKTPKIKIQRGVDKIKNCFKIKKEKKEFKKMKELKFRCPNCGNAQVYTRKDGTSRCVRCGYENKTEKFEVKKEKKSK